MVSAVVTALAPFPRGCAVALACAATVAGCQQGPRADDPASIRDALRREFGQAYPAEPPATTDVVSYELVAAPTQVELFDGRALTVWAYNGQVPGPTLRVRRGQRLRVTFRNQLAEPTTVHWHGVRVPNGMDGVPGVTQPPVPPGGTFTYEFAPPDAGTFWFHPHIRSPEQVERGLFGVLVVEDAQPLPYSQDVVWVIDDWRLTKDGSAIDPRFVTGGDLMHDGRWGQVITVNGRTDHELAVRPGERIRLRLINVANGRVFAPVLDGLDAKVIAVDGMYAREPFALGSFEMAPGNRLDVELTIPRDARGAIFSMMDVFGRRPNRLAGIRVLDDVVATPPFASPARAQVPRWEAGVGLAPDLDFSLDARRGGPFGIEWTINGKVHGGHDHAGHDPAGHGDHAGHVAIDYKLVANRWSKLRFTNVSGRLHPMHLHGAFFRVLARDGQPVDEPHWRDTVLVRPRQTVDVGLVPLDAGKWMMHCHILEHAESGMMTLIEVTN